MTGMRYKNVNLVIRTQKWIGPVGCFGQIENIKRQALKYRGVKRFIKGVIASIKKQI